MRWLSFPLLMLALSASPQELTLAEATALALEKSPELVVERESVAIANASVLRAEAVYEPSLRGEARVGERTDPVNSILSGAPRGELGPTTDTVATSASMVRLLPTGGTVTVFSGLHRDSTNSVLSLLTPSWTSVLGAEVRQPLMQNRRVDPARRAIRIARADRSRAHSSLRRIATELIASVERAWWSAVAAREDVELRQSAVALAEKQREDTLVRITAGTQAEADLAQTDAELQRRKGELAVSRDNARRSANALRALVARDAVDPVWDRPLGFDDTRAAAFDAQPEAQAAIATALASRSDLDELASGLERNDIEIDSALDRVRPQVDLVASYSARGLSGTPNEDALQPFGPVVVPGELNGGVGSSLQTLAGNEFPDASIGVAVVIPIGNTAARQDVVIARARRRQSEATIEAARKRIALEVRNALSALESANERLQTTRAAVQAAEIQLQAEHDRFEGGTSNTFFILTRQNDLAAARAAETIAASDRRKAETELARAMGTLLERRGIAVEPGDAR